MSACLVLLPGYHAEALKRRKTTGELAGEGMKIEFDDSDGTLDRPAYP
jgi:hypothetical protein